MMTKIRALMIAIGLMATHPGATLADDYSRGMDAFFAGKCKSAAKLLKPAAEYEPQPLQGMADLSKMPQSSTTGRN